MLLSLTAVYGISFQLWKKSNNNEKSETMLRSTRKRKFTFDDGTAVEPEGDASLDVFSD